MDSIGEDTVVVRFKSDMSEMTRGLRVLREQAEQTRQEMNRKGTGGGMTPAERAGWRDRRLMRQRELRYELWAQELTKREVKRAHAEAMAAIKHETAMRKKAEAWEREAIRMTKAEEKRAHATAMMDLKHETAMRKKAEAWERQAIRMTKAEVSRAHSAALREERRVKKEAAEGWHRRITLARAHAAALKENERHSRTLWSRMQRAGTGMADWAKQMERGWFHAVSWVRSIRYVAYVITGALRSIVGVLRTAFNAFMALMNLWKNVVTTALKLGAAVGVALAGALALATKQAIDFESAMLRVGGVLGRNLQQMGALSRAVRDVAKATTIAASEIAEGAFRLASFGFGERRVAGMLPGVTALAMAASGEGGQASYERAAETVARMLLIWQRPARDAMRVANLLAAANANSAATFDRLATAMPKAAQAANLARMPMEELVGTLSQLMNAGMEGSQAGAALLMMITRLMNPTEEFAEAISGNLRRYGMTMRDLNPAVVGFRNALINLQRLGLTPTQIATFRNRTGLIAMNILLRQGVREHDRMTRAITGTNQAVRQASIMVSGVKGRWDFFLASLKELAITISEKLRPVLAWLLDKVGRWVNWLSSTPQVRSLANALGVLAKHLAETAINLLYNLNVAKWFPVFMRTLENYMRRTATIMLTFFGLLEWAFRNLINPNSPMRTLWGSFWDFVEDSVVLATQGVVGVITGAIKLIELAMQRSGDLAKQWGTLIGATVVEVARIVAIEVMKIAGNLSFEIGKAILPLAAIISGLSVYAPQLAPMAAGLIGGVYAAGKVGRGLLTEAYRMEAEKPEETVKRVRQRVSGIAAAVGKNALPEGSPLEQAIQTGTAAGTEWGGRVRGMIQDVRAGAGGVRGLPVTSAIGRGMFGGIDAFHRAWTTANREVQQAFGPEGRGMLPGEELGDDMEDLADAIKGNTSVVEKFGDRLEGLAYKIIGAPQEVIGQYVSAAGMAGHVGSPMSALFGMPLGPKETIVTLNLQWTPDLVETVRMRVQDGTSQIIDRRIKQSWQQAAVPLTGGAR